MRARQLQQERKLIIPKELKGLRVAIIHDFLVQIGGAEKILQSFVEIFPQAEVFTMIADDKTVKELIPNQKIHLSFLQKMPFCPKKYKLYLGLMPKATESFSLKEYDLVLSITSAFVKGVITDNKKTLHICYLNTPTRYLWDITDFYLKTTVSNILIPVVKLLLPYLRSWDLKAAKRPDLIIANSKNIDKRMRRHYHRKSDAIIFPWADVKRFFQNKNEDDSYYLLAGRMVPYKRNDIVIEAFNQLKLPLKVIGTGYGLEQLKKLNTNPNTIFLGRVTDKELIKIFQRCKAFIFPSLEDFGIAPIEAMAAGKPVIAFGQGGALETVVADKTGIFFDSQTPDAIIKSIHRFERKRFNYRVIQEHTLQFSKESFNNKIIEFIQISWKKFQKRRQHGSI